MEHRSFCHSEPGEESHEVRVPGFLVVHHRYQMECMLQALTFANSAAPPSA